ncbi:hypothetical protein BTO30_14790 [Domibacillus antri]|uniref:Uncharacterized protein n=1 Tax=Domibacillus antri TaxID=1714264 RepID=A0A1Q8Q2B8_9BACI|nr:hypothetical protein [Domibacillus antri]OLN21467.1 hypothetical protein BTO30_14790 [Domibacillus antri]
MSNNENIKGALIQTKKKNKMPKPEPIQFNQLKDPFKFSPAASSADKTEINEKVENKFESQATKKQPEKIKMDPPNPEEKKTRKSVVGKKNAVKSIKVPAKLHTQISVLGKFMDESKTYAILDQLITHYVSTELSDRQKKQFEYMSEFLNEN